MVQAAASGLVDFNQAKFYDEPWQRKLRLLLKGLHNENERHIKAIQHSHHIGQLGMAGISPESAGKVQERAGDDMWDLINLYRPWAAQTKDDREKEAIQGLTNRWQRRWGDMDDPDVKKKIDEAADMLRRRREEAEPLSTMGDYFTVFNKQTAGATGELRK